MSLGCQVLLLKKSAAKPEENFLHLENAFRQKFPLMAGDLLNSLKK